MMTRCRCSLCHGPMHEIPDGGDELPPGWTTMHCDACNSTEPVELPHVIHDPSVVFLPRPIWDQAIESGLIVVEEDNSHRGVVVWNGWEVCPAYLDEFIPDDDDHVYVVEDKSNFVAFWEKQGLEPKPTLSELQQRFFKRLLGLDFSDEGEK